MSTIELRDFTGPSVRPWLDELARLRIAVFREWPYLYDGDVAYEKPYLAAYAASPRSLFVLALLDGRVVGASTGIPLADEGETFQRPFLDRGIAPASVFYFGESVLLPEHRGRGVGGRFFDHREAYARSLRGVRRCAFCAVERPADHPCRPTGFVPLDTFWRRRGYTKRPDLTTQLAWRELGEAGETLKPMTFWTRPLDG
jgi:GNAT superfamily N-acetyltransferase